MPEHRGVSAAEKYAELGKAGASRPRCSCHGEEMQWNRHSDRRPDGGRWKCSVANRETCRRWHEANPERAKAKNRHWREANPEKHAAKNARRLWGGGVYLGRCGFTQTEVEMMLSGTSE